MPLLPWQQYLIDEASKVKPDGTWAYKNVLAIAARQVGKTHLLRMRILAGLYLWDEELQIASAQTRDLSLETFKKVIEVIENYDWLRKKVKHVTRANGREEVMLKNGMRYKIVASNSGGARGLSSDLVILDELRQQKTYDAYSALVFTMNARPNSQFWGISNAGDHYSLVLNAMRQRALDKIEKNLDDPLCFMEWSASPHRKLSDIEGWKEANETMMAANKMRKIVITFVSLTILLVAGFGIYNILNMVIYEKMNDIAILKATGFSGSDVKKIFIYQAMFIGIVGGLLGLLLGGVMSYAISKAPFETEAIPTVKTFPVNFDPLFYLIGSVFALITTFFAGYLPAKKASKIDPVDIIRGQ